MNQADVRKQFETAISNVESALQDLTERLESLPGSIRGSRMRRAGKTIRRTADSMVDHLPLERASSMVADTGRVVRQHPFQTVLTAAVAGYGVWLLLRYVNNRSESQQHRRHAERMGERMQYKGAEIQPDAESYARH